MTEKLPFNVVPVKLEDLPPPDEEARERNRKVDQFLCPECGERAIYHTGEFETLIGYTPFVDDEGREHLHDDNCVRRCYVCPNGHGWNVSVSTGLPPDCLTPLGEQ